MSTETTREVKDGCTCATQITDMLARLETLEREALTVEKLANDGSLPGHIAEALKKHGYT